MGSGNMLLQRVIRSAVLILTISVAINATASRGTERQMADEVSRELKKFDETGEITPRLSEILNQLPLTRIFSMKPSAAITARDDIICTACNAALDAVIDYIHTHSQEDLLRLITTLCVQIVNYNEIVCSGLIELNLDTVLYIFNDTEGIQSSRVCGIFLQGSECSKDDLSLEWTVDIDLGPKPEVKRTDNTKAEDADVLTIIQLSDIHYEPPYLPGGNAECDAPMCCRNDQGQPSNPEAAAGYWGDYNCDTPWNVFDDTLKQIKKTHPKIDYVYVTGDFVDHAVWDTSIQGNTEVITNITQRLKEDFPDTPVYPILGNHEPSPLNVYAPHDIDDEKVSTLWLYKLVAELWSDWLPEEAKETILRGGFYTALARPGFRIIALNNNVCYTFNWWLFYNPKDQDGQLHWLAETLLKAEAAGEKVHILGHIPSGSSECLRTWSREFHRIIDRFEHTITAIFNGHTHNDHFHVYYAADETTRPVSVAINGGSVTTFTNLNSNYKIYSIDSATYYILDTECWIFDLEEANKNASTTPTWFKLYSFKDEYGVESLTATELDKLTHKLAINRSLLEQYSRHYVKDARNNCDTECLRNRLCYTATAKMGDLTQCNRLLCEFDGACISDRNH